MMQETSPEAGSIGSRYLRLGSIMAALAFVADQGHKWWMLNVFGITENDVVVVTPFFDLVLLWNKGISYGLFQQESAAGQWALLAVTMVIVAIMVRWLFTADNPVVAIAIGLVIGGALGNATDRVIYGAVADFISLHAFGYRWYVFNIADVAIVAGMVLLLYDSFMGNKATAD